METFNDRLVTEFEELKEKTEKLRSFIWDGEAFEKLHRPDQALLIEQHATMRQYCEILTNRLARAS